MASVVDFGPRQVAEAPVVPGTSDFTCAACAECFSTSAEHRQHAKSERHLYNTKRRLNGLKPISQEAWERKLKESRAAGAAAKGTSHLKPGKEKKGGSAASEATPSSKATGEQKEAAVLTACDSLFDRKSFRSVEAAISYMQRNYSFYIPDHEYCTDVPGLMAFLAEKLSKPPHACIYCNRSFPDLASVRCHMIDKCHTHIGTEARTRRGNIDEAASDVIQAELERFFDFSGSTREITERMQPPQQIASILRYFDRDRDGYLKKEELAALWSTMQDGAELSDTQYYGACQLVNVDPKMGLDAEDLGQLYAEGFADLVAHFKVLQDLLARPKPKKNKAEERQAEATEGEAEDKTQAEETQQDEGDEGEEEEEEEGSEDGDSDGTEYVECEDEDEFEEVMRVLGLQQVSLSETGDLRLPNGNVATNRDVQHIYKQRGKRLDQQQLALVVGLAGGKRFPGKKSQLMLSNGASGCHIAVSQRQQARDGKRVVAFLRKKQWDDMKRGVKQNLLQTQPGQMNRTGRGDCSFGR